MKRFTFLYTELAEYIMACLEALELAGHHIEVVRWPVNNEAPFELRKLSRTTFHDRAQFTDQSLLQWLNTSKPDVIICSGWMDRSYVQAVANITFPCVKVMAFDNHWTGELRQQLGAMYARLKFTRHFTHAWVPGAPQVPFALKLGFAKNRIATGFYCADTAAFSAFYSTHPERKTTLPERFIFIGRYVDFKGIFELWSAFSALRQDAPQWEMISIGTGDRFNDRQEMPNLHHVGFVQPTNLPHYLEQAGVFVLPSHKEPWGVVVHELAAAGFPMICTQQVGAATAFVNENENGYIIPANNVNALYEAMKKMTALSAEARANMGQRSHELAQKITLEKWVQTALSFANSAVEQRQ